MKAWTIVIVSLLLIASSLSLTAGVVGLGDGDKSATPMLLGSSAGLILVALIMAVALKTWNSRPRPDLDD